jgi:hypothetical protein
MVPTSELSEKNITILENSPLETPSGGITIVGSQNNVAADEETGQEQLAGFDADSKGSTAVGDSPVEDAITYPTGFPLVIILVALILNIFLVYLQWVFDLWLQMANG